MANRRLFEFSQNIVYDGETDTIRLKQAADVPVVCFPSDYPTTLKTRALDEILDFQKIDKDLFYAFLGRWFFDMGDLDDWGLTPAIIGLPATGKSSILQMLRKIYGDKAGVVSASSLRGRSILNVLNYVSWIAPDVLRDTPIARLQSPGKLIIPSFRGKRMAPTDWRAPGWIGGNEAPQNDANLYIFRFDTPPESCLNPFFSEALSRQAPSILVRSIRAYHAALRKYGRQRPVF